MSRIQQIEDMLLESPDDCFLLHALALENVKLGNMQKAQTLFEQLLTINENYVGSYYHLAKLFEETGNEQAAISTYEKGMHIAKALQENHAYGELRSAYEELTM